MKNNIRWNLRQMSHSRRKVTPEIVESMLKRRAAGESIGSIARSEGLAHSTVSDILAGRIWRGVGMGVKR